MSGIPNRADSAAARQARSSAGPSRNGVGTDLSSLVRTRPDVVGASRRIPWLSGRRWLLFSLVLGTSGLGTSLMLRIVGSGGIHALEVAIVLLFACTFGWISVAFWTGLFGFGLQLFRRDPLTLARIRSPAPLGRPGQRTEEPLASRTAIVMPVCNEDSARVIEGLKAVIRSVAQTGQGDGFDAFLLSDSTDPEVSRKEEVAWKRWMERSVPGFGRCVYRRRETNQGRKVGNIADFCERWGADYDFMVVLDADSLMTGSTLLALVRRMEATPDAGVIQTVPIPARQVTLFGRMLQFAAALQAPLLGRRTKLLAGRRRQLLGPQRHPSGASLHGARPAARPPGKTTTRWRDPQPRLRGGRPPSPRRMEGLPPPFSRWKLRAAARKYPGLRH